MRISSIFNYLTETKLTLYTLGLSQSIAKAQELAGESAHCLFEAFSYYWGSNFYVCAICAMFTFRILHFVNFLKLFKENCEIWFCFHRNLFDV